MFCGRSSALEQGREEAAIGGQGKLEGRRHSHERSFSFGLSAIEVQPIVGNLGHCPETSAADWKLVVMVG